MKKIFEKLVKERCDEIKGLTEEINHECRLYLNQINQNFNRKK